MARSLVIVDHILEADLCGNPAASPFVMAADFHFLARQMVAHEVDLETCIGRIIGIGEPTIDFLQRRQRLFGHLLIALHIADLFVIAQRDQIEGIRRILVTRMDLEETLRRLDCLVVILGDIIAERAHQLCPAGPWRIGMLAFHLVEQGGSESCLATVEPPLCLAIQRFHVASDIGSIGWAAAAAGAGRGHQRRACKRGAENELRRGTGLVRHG